VKRRRRAKDANAAAPASATDANYHVSMATDGGLVGAGAVVTRPVSSQLARKQVNGAERAGSRCAQRRAPSDRHQRPSTASSVAGGSGGVHLQGMIRSKIFYLLNNTVRCSLIPQIAQL